MGGKSSKQKSKSKKCKEDEGEEDQTQEQTKEQTEEGTVANGDATKEEKTEENSTVPSGDKAEASDFPPPDENKETEPAVTVVQVPLEEKVVDEVVAKSCEDEEGTPDSVSPSDPPEPVEIISESVKEAESAPPPPPPPAEEQPEATANTEPESAETEAQELPPPAADDQDDASKEPELTPEQAEKSGAEEESTPAAPSDTAETGAATAGEAETGETAAPSESSKIPMEFKWDEGGDKVLVSGTFNSWSEQIALSKEGNVFTKTIDLPAGEYLYKFIVDEQWVVNKNLPIKCDDNGLENNVLLVQPVS